MQLFWSVMIRPILFQWSDKKAPLTMAKHCCVLGSCFLLLASMGWVWSDKIELDTAALESPFATCSSKEEQARLYNETQKLWRMAGSGCGPPRTHPWTWHERDCPQGITSWEGMPRYSHSTASLGRQWEPFGDAGLRYERSWIIVPKTQALSCQLLVAQTAPWPLTEREWQGE